MNITEVIKSLKDKAATDRVAADVFHMFATRDRARSSITIRGLERRMESEGFTHPRAKLASVLEYLGQLGLGHAQRNAKGEVILLNKITVTLMSIGQAALHPAATSLTALRRRARYGKIAPSLPPKAAPIAAPAPAPAVVPEPKPAAVKPGLTLGVPLSSGRRLLIDLPQDFALQDLQEVVKKLTG